MSDTDEKIASCLFGCVKMHGHEVVFFCVTSRKWCGDAITLSGPGLINQLIRFFTLGYQGFYAIFVTHVF